MALSYLRSRQVKEDWGVLILAIIKIKELDQIIQLVKGSSVSSSLMANSVLLFQRPPNIIKPT